MKKVLSFLLAVFLIINLAACAKNQSTSASEVDSPNTHVITDHKGNQVEVPNEINRIVVCDVYPLPSILTVFFDSAEKIVGMAPQSMSAAKNSLLSELYPEILQASTSFTDGTSVNMEELLKLEPDVVFYNAGNATLGEELQKVGLAAVAISAGKWQYDALATLNGWIDVFAQLMNTNDKAEKVEAYGKEIQALVEDRVTKLSEEERQSVFFIFQYSETNLLTSGNPSFGSWWASAIGANSVVTETTPQNSLKTSMEQIYTWNPDVIFITNFTTATVDDILNSKIGTDNWSPLQAVKNRRVYKMPLGMYRSYTAGVDAPVAYLWLAKACYPDLFQDVDVTEKTVSYYQEVFGITLTTDQAKKIFNPLEAAGQMK